MVPSPFLTRLEANRRELVAVFDYQIPNLLNEPARKIQQSWRQHQTSLREAKSDLFDCAVDKPVVDTVEQQLSPIALPEHGEESGKWPDPLLPSPQDNFSEEDLLDSFHKTSFVRVYCCTWNLAGRPGPENLKPILPPGYHIYAIGTEECERTIAKSAVVTSKKNWERKLESALGDSYVLLRSHTLQAIHLAVYLHKSLEHMASHAESGAVATGFVDTLGNKGGVGVCFNLGLTSLLFINSHFESGQQKVQQRNANYHRIDTQLHLPAYSRHRWMFARDEPEKLDQTGSSTRSLEDGMGTNTKPLRLGYEQISPGDTAQRVTQRFDRVVWMGDFNYRINGQRASVASLIGLDKSAHNLLLANDQLKIEMLANRVFHGFKEAPLNFFPSYKFDTGKDTYDSSKKQRVPSWTDRILYYTPREGTISQISYNSCTTMRTSDHKPVFAAFRVHIQDSEHVTSPVVTGQGESQVCSIA